MPVFLGEASPLDLFKCDCCGKMAPKAMMHEHHIVKRASGGQDHQENITTIDAYCHTAVHQIEAALKNPKKQALIPDLLLQMFPESPQAQKNCLFLATSAARPSTSASAVDYGMWDTDDEVALVPPPKVHPEIRKMVKIIAKELKNPTSGRSLGVSGYLKMLVLTDLQRRGFNVLAFQNKPKS